LHPFDVRAIIFIRGDGQPAKIADRANAREPKASAIIALGVPAQLVEENTVLHAYGISGAGHELLDTAIARSNNPVPPRHGDRPLAGSRAMRRFSRLLRVVPPFFERASA